MTEHYHGYEIVLRNTDQGGSWQAATFNNVGVYTKTGFYVVQEDALAEARMTVDQLRASLQRP
jgi:hypothetical protein